MSASPYYLTAGPGFTFAFFKAGSIEVLDVMCMSESDSWSSTLLEVVIE